MPADAKSRRVHVEIKAAPFVKDPPYAPDFYEAIGRIVVLWGRMEASLDTFLLVVVNVAAHHGVERDMKVSLSTKVRLLRELFGLVSVLKERYGGFDGVLTRILESSQARSRIVHSFVEGFEDGEPPRLVLRSIRHKSGQMLIGRSRASLDDFWKFAEEINRLHGHVVLRLMAISPLQPGFETAGRAPRPAPSDTGRTPGS